MLLTLLYSCLAQAWETNNKHFFVGKEVIFFKCLSIVPLCGIQARKHIIFSPPPKRVHVLDLTISITIRVSDKIVYQKKVQKLKNPHFGKAFTLKWSNAFTGIAPFINRYYAVQLEIRYFHAILFGSCFNKHILLFEIS